VIDNRHDCVTERPRRYHVPVAERARNCGPWPRVSSTDVNSKRRNVMRKELIAGVVAAAALWPALAAAQSPAQEGYREGYRAGGPVGGVVGGTVGAAVEFPGDVLGFVTGHPRRYDRVQEEIVVGEPLPRTVHVYAIPKHRDYAYAYVNDRRVIVNPGTRRVVRVVE
jgi:hypothetical protein